MSNMETYYKQLAESTDNINDKNMYERQARKEAIRAFKKKRQSLGTEAYMKRRIKEKAEYYKQIEEAKKNKPEESEDKLLDDSFEGEDTIHDDSFEENTPKKKKRTKKKASKKKASTKSNKGDK